MAVLGSHPHVLQGWERIDTADGRSTLVAYSLGNFVSNQQVYPRAVTVMLFLGLGRDASGRLAVEAVRYLPAVVDRTGADGRDAVVRPAQSDSDNPFSRQAWCLTSDLFGLAWQHPWTESEVLSGAAGPVLLADGEAPGLDGCHSWWFIANRG